MTKQKRFVYFFCGVVEKNIFLNKLYFICVKLVYFIIYVCINKKTKII